jgi:hypothetical protein
MLNKRNFINTAVAVAFSVTSYVSVAADCKDVPVADGQVGIHYNRPDGKYDDWGVHLWKSPNIGITNWFIPKMPTGCDSFGMYWYVPLSKFGETKVVNYIIHKGDVKEQGGTDMSFDANKGKEIWVNSGNPTIFMSKDDAVKAQAVK